MAPGNGGTADIAENVPDLDVMDSEALLAFVRERQIGLVVIGPEAVSYTHLWSPSAARPTWWTSPTTPSRSPRCV